MYINNIGTLIKQLRKEHNITAEDLAFEVGCDVTTLSKIENNKREPSARVFEAIMTRFGSNPNANYDIWVMAKDYNTYQNIKMIKDMLFQKKHDEVEKLIGNLEKEKSFSNGLNLQFLLSAKISVLSSRREDPSVIIELIYKAIKITKEYFHERYIEQYFLSYDELRLINILAIQYSRFDHLEQAIDVLYKVKSSMDKSFIDDEEKAKIYPMIIHNLTKYLGLSNKHEEVIELCKLGREICIKQNKYHFLPNILVNYACALYYIGDMDSCKKYFNQAYVLFQATDRFKEESQTKEYIGSNFNIQI